MINQDEKTMCENCKYFIKHYYLFKGKLIYAHSGHCTAPRHKSILRPKDNCDKWELNENEESKYKEPIEKGLLHMAKQIEEIAAILKSEN